MDSIETALDEYVKTFGVMPPLYQLRFFDDETAIQMIESSISSGIQISAEELEKTIPPGALY